MDGKTDKLVRYTYKNGNGRLKQITYANGDTMKAAYNSIGQMVAEKWFDNSGTLKAYYKYVYDGQGNIVRLLDIPNGKEYTYTYEDGRIIHAAESDIEVSGEIVISKEAVNTVKYYYDSEGKLTKKVITPASGSAQTVYYENPEGGNAVTKFTAGGRTVTSHSKTDSFRRKVFDELQLGTGFVSRQFSYQTGEVTQEHIDGEKLKSSPTTQLVSRIVLSDGRTLSYEYDAEERITKLTDSVDGVTEYTYDALGQLLTETHNGTVVNSMTYDNYGNILSKNGKVYTYGDPTWKDLLTSFDGQSIIYDNQGNPTSYLGHTLTWEKGRQLKSFDSNTYTYNTNGIRTSKTVNGVKHTYTLDGTKILRETWGDNTLIPLYDNEDSICGIIYNGTPFYFQKNLHGDIIGIVDKDTTVVAKYTYDAWGVCTVVHDSSNFNIATVNPFRYRGYYYDDEIGMYYLQSRYFNPSVGRFVNADDPEFIEATNSIINHDMFVYCENNAVNKTDEAGMSIIRTVGIGFQIELNVSWRTYGMEFVWYLESRLRNGRAWYIPYVYLYGGGGLSSDLTSLVSKITKNPSLLFNPKSLTKASASISIFAIFGYSNFTGPRSYEGWFTSVSATVWNAKAYTAWCGTCIAVGVGLSTSKFSASTGGTYYALNSTIYSAMTNVYNNFSAKAKKIKR